MDELAFRSSQKIENIQLQAQLAAAKTKDVIALYSQQMKLFIFKLLESTKVEQLQSNIKELIDKFVNDSKQLKAILIYYSNPQRIYQGFIKVFGKRWTKRDIYFGCAGLFIGIIVGIYIGVPLRKREPVVQYMRAVQCKYYSGCESVTVVEDVIAPFECGEYEVLVNVKAASIQTIDIKICNGYGRTLRKILQNVYKSQSDSPVILGRDCTGIITDVGCKVKRLEVGDEIWLAVPFWLQGTLCQTLLVSENYVSRKPKNVGFEGASSIPYAGSLALSSLEEANIISSNAHNKKILVHGGCTPVGCILIQLLKYWNATVTTTCYRKAVPIAKALGASDVIIVSEPIENTKSKLETNDVSNVSSNVLIKELELRGDIYDVIIKTTDSYDDYNLSKYCKHKGAIISTLPPSLPSDSYGYLRKLVYYLYIKLKHEVQSIFGLPINYFEETHLCYVTLDRLMEFVEDGHLQTVVDKVFVPEDIELAISHIQNPLSIGSTIVTFR